MDHVFVLGLDREADADLRVERLVAEHQTKLARYLRRFFADADLAQDVAQETFFAAYRAIRRDPDRPLTAGWLYKTATHFAISQARKNKRRGATVPLSEVAGALRSDERDVASLDLQIALRTLGEEQLACVLLTSYAGYSSAEAALLLGTTADAVRQRVCRAMRAMRGKLEERG